MMFKRVYRGLAALVLSACCSCGMLEKDVELTNRAGSAYSLRIGLDEDGFYVKHGPEGEHKKLHSVEGTIDDHVIDKREYFIVTQGTPEFPGGHPESVSRILFYQGAYCEGDGKKCMLEFQDPGSEAGDHEHFSTGVQEGVDNYFEDRQFSLIVLPENTYVVLFDPETGRINVDLNGDSLMPHEIYWGDKVYFTQEDGTLIDIEKMINPKTE